MLPIVQTTIAVVVAVSTWSVQAQPAATKSPAASAPMTQDCAKAVKPHDHGMERGAGRTVPLPCDRAAAASAPKAKRVHDHAKVHNK